MPHLSRQSGTDRSRPPRAATRGPSHQPFIHRVQGMHMTLREHPARTIRGAGAGDGARRGRKPWRQEEIEQLRTLADDGCPARVIAHHLGRTARSVVNKAWELAIPLGFSERARGRGR